MGYPGIHDEPVGPHRQKRSEARRQSLIGALAELQVRDTLEDLIEAIRGCARSLAAADGITIVHREGDKVRYVAEDAIAPLWSGQSFPVQDCISGLAMIQNRPILIPDIYADPRVPHAAYEPTFVHSMAVFPIGTGNPVWALGAYWAKVGPIDDETVTLLSSFARSAAFAFERLTQPRQSSAVPPGERMGGGATPSRPMQ